MDAGIKTLARRAVACEGWPWMAGVSAFESNPKYPEKFPVTEWRVLKSRKHNDGSVSISVQSGKYYRNINNPQHKQNGGWLPDLNDPATKGCLLEMVRRAWDDSDISPGYQSGSWFINTSGHQIISDSYVEVLVLALEVAQESKGGQLA